MLSDELFNNYLHTLSWSSICTTNNLLNTAVNRKRFLPKKVSFILSFCGSKHISERVKVA